MSDLIGIVGSSGTGKTTAIHSCEELGIMGLNPEETVIINVSGKPLSFRGWRKYYKPFTGEKGNYLTTDNSEKIVKALKLIDSNRPEIKNIVIEDFQYTMAFEFMNKVMEKGYEKFNVIGKKAFDIINTARTLRDDIKVFITTHSEEIQKDFETVRKMKTLGKMLDSVITLEGLFTVLLYADATWDEKSEKGEYFFITNKTSDYPAKSPFGMFDDIKINNDLGYVSQKVDEYNNG